LGGSVTARIKRRVVCRGCRRADTPARRERCAQCGKCPAETRTVHRQMGPGMVVQQQEEVPSREKCADEVATLDAVIEKGMDAGQVIRTRGRGARAWRARAVGYDPPCVRVPRVLVAPYHASRTVRCDRALAPWR
jgi:hypothetical protein